MILKTVTFDIKEQSIGFRESPLFTQWRAILSPHFQNPPIAEHFQTINKI